MFIRRKKWNKYPYIILFIFHSAMLIFTFYKKKDRKSLSVLLFSIMGMAFIFDYFVLSFFRGYTYRPKFLRNKHLDSVLGATLSQAIYVPFTALFITAFQLGWKVKWLFTLYFVAVESIFEFLGIYKRKWWKKTYTFLLIPVYFFITDKWWQLLKSDNPPIKIISLYNIFHFICINGIFILEVLGKIRFGYSMKKQIKIIPTYVSILAFIRTWTIIKCSQWARVLWMIAVLGVDRILFRLGVIRAKSMYPLTFIHIVTLILGNIFKKWIEESGKTTEDHHQQKA
ncbi:hypothetical protein QA612_17520 [Evansella sp. AB-P1]|uniref:hypothetical protein n=1 Tax=Evansella sp. AB-P1 TaxID=3037653 RepID=UPI00241DA6D9|nr:hypothetical protein [Evansella sp. AB-P1]MDG5789262.1 hypothetical protein [Evansella sp. AB-P1]